MLLGLVLSLCLLCVVDGLNFGCYQAYSDGSFYDLTPLKDNSKDYIQQLATGQTLVFNVCRDTIKSCNGHPSMSSLWTGGACTDITGPAASGSWSPLDNDVDGVQIAFTNGERCTDARERHVTFQFTCDHEAASTAPVVWNTTDGCNVVITKATPHACAYISLSSIFSFITRSSSVLGAIMIVVGLAETFYGFRLVKPTIFISASVLVFFAATTFSRRFIVDVHPSDLQMGLLLAGCAVLGVIIGGLAIFVIQLGVFLLGFWGGTVLALLLNNLFLYKIEASPAALPLYIAIGVLGVVCGALSLKTFKHAIVLLTSIVGAYLIVRGVSLYAGHFPNELLSAPEYIAGHFDTMPWQYYVYLSAILLLSVAGYLFQTRSRRLVEAKLQPTYSTYGAHSYGRAERERLLYGQTTYV